MGRAEKLYRLAGGKMMAEKRQVRVETRGGMKK